MPRRLAPNSGCSFSYRSWDMASDSPFNGGAGYCAALRIGTFDLRNVRTRLIVRALSSGGSRHGKTVISALGASDATSIDVCSGCDDVSSGRTRIGVRQPAMNERGTL